MTQHQVIILGSGIVGLTTAALIAQTSINKIAIVDQKLPPLPELQRDYDLRCYAISLAAVEIFKRIGCWESIKAKRVGPYNQIKIWDETGAGQLQFNAQQVKRNNLGHIIEHWVLVNSLYELLQKHPKITWYQGKAQQIESQNRQNHLTISQGAQQQKLIASLIVGADGGHSWLRSKMGISIHEKDYQQQGLVAVIKTEKQHQNIAFQKFLKTGPLACLPLCDKHLSSIVWTAPTGIAQQLLSMPHAEFTRQLQQAFGETLGTIALYSERACFSLVRRHAKTYVQPGIALVGDAAHIVHPLAGQGLNLGLLDAAELMNQLNQTKLESSSLWPKLRAYARARAAHNANAMYAFDAIQRVYSNTHIATNWLRNFALNTANTQTWIKQELIEQALGLRALAES